MSSANPEQSSMNDFEEEVAKKVILPKLQEAYRAATDDITSKAQLRKVFNDTHGVSLSAAKFEEYLSVLNIQFTKRVVIENLFPASPPRRSAGAEEPEEDDDFVFDNETSPPTRGGQNPLDMFGLA